MSKIFYKKDFDQIHQFIESLNYDKALILADAKTNGFCLPILKKTIPFFKNLPVVTIPDGEQNKNIEVAQYIFYEYLKNEIGKKSIIFHLGGGVLTDMGAFCASVYKRGIRFVNIPTTLLAMCDASIGGKNGIDFLNFKNILGTIVPAEAVIINEDFLQTLPQRQIRSAYAEIIKHYVLLGKVGIKKLMNITEEDFVQKGTIAQNIIFKTLISSSDLKDEGKRQILNFGHTIGHAIESIGLQNGKNIYLHGEAIMLGMIYESRLSEKINRAKPQITKLLIELKKRFFEDVHYQLDINEMKQFIVQDKKRNGDIKMSLLNANNECDFNMSVSIDDVINVILECNQEM